MIKLRAYIKTLKLIVPVSRINFDCETIEVDISSGNGDLVEYDFDEVILMRYTGLKDKNGVEIYEGDIIRDEQGVGEIKFLLEHCAYFARTIKPHCYHYLLSDGQLHKTEIIGNIHDNPELLS